MNAFHRDRLTLSNYIISTRAAAARAEQPRDALRAFVSSCVSLQRVPR